MRRRTIIATIILISSLYPAVDAQVASSAPENETGFLRRAVTVGANTYYYQVYVPRDFNPAGSTPSFCIFTVRGGRAVDNERQIGHGLGSVIVGLLSQTDGCLAPPNKTAPPTILDCHGSNTLGGGFLSPQA